ncbi:MAG: antA/AntB antirepressor family protein [Burkholderiales bacterium]|nr:antA/AntB antirepressor family protein [Burkholderiales bacterium]
MSNQLPMTINPSVNYNNNFHLIKIPQLGQHPFLDALIVEANTQTISEEIAIFLGISSDECIQHIGVENFTHCQLPYDGFHGHYIRYIGISLDQLRTLVDIAKSKGAIKFIPILSELILTQVLPLFNPPQQIIKHDDFKEETIMSTTTSTTNQLINIQKSDFNGQLTETVNLRELHEFLGVKSKFAVWVQNRIEKYSFEENQDYVSVSKILETGQNSNLRTTVIEYYGTIDMAKELCMVENNEKGRTMRKHFIERDKQLTKIEQQPLAIPQSLPEALRLAAVLAEEKDQLQLERDVAIKTKAQIGSKREASIMGKLSQANAKIRQLESQGTLDLKGEKLSLMQIANKLNVSPHAIARVIADLGIMGLPSLGEVRYMKDNGKTIQDWFYNPVAVGLIKQTLEGRSRLS